MDVDRESRLHAHSLRLEYLTIVWMIVETAIAVASGVQARSVALTGFGFDSLIEIFAAAIVIRHLRGPVSEERERRALRFIAVSFFVLAAYIAAESSLELIARRHARESIAGIVLAAAALIVMPLLVRAKRKTARATDNATMLAESAQSSLCAYLAAILLAGLVVNAAFGWWWADPVAALGIAGLAVREGTEAWKGRECC